jgi:DNA-binding transcriptional regulator YhcF (GntR family)
MKLGLAIDWQAPAGAQIVAQIEEIIRSGKLKPGERLPGVREAALEAGISFNTAARAYRQLRDAGWVVMRQGQGAYVANPLREEMDPQERDQKLRELALKYLYEASRLKAAPDEAVRVLERIGAEVI